MEDGLHVEQTLYDVDGRGAVAATNITYDPLMERAKLEVCVHSLVQTLTDLLEKLAQR